MTHASASRMRVLHLGKYYAPERGGIESYTQALCEWTAAEGHGVAALVPGGVDVEYSRGDQPAYWWLIAAE